MRRIFARERLEPEGKRPRPLRHFVPKSPQKTLDRIRCPTPNFADVEIPPRALSSTRRVSAGERRESLMFKHRMKGVTVEGMRDKVEGKLKETEGKLTDDELREKQGQAEQKVGEGKEQLEDAKDEARDRI